MDNANETLSNWVFPELTNAPSPPALDPDFKQEFGVDAEAGSDAALTMDTTTTADELNPANLAVLESANDSAARELQQEKEKYERNNATLTELIHKLKDFPNLLNEELFIAVEDIIKKIVKKIILKEIALDSKILNKMVASLKNEVPSNSGLITIFVSHEDFSKIDLVEPDVAIEERPDLTAGDIIIKCNTSEIHARMLERIENLLRTVHE